MTKIKFTNSTAREATFGLYGSFEIGEIYSQRASITELLAVLSFKEKILLMKRLSEEIFSEKIYTEEDIEAEVDSRLESMREQNQRE